MTVEEIIALIKQHWGEYQYRQGSHEQKALIERDPCTKEDHIKQTAANENKSEALSCLLAEIDPNEQIWDKRGWYKRKSHEPPA